MSTLKPLRNKLTGYQKLANSIANDLIDATRANKVSVTTSEDLRNLFLEFERRFTEQSLLLEESSKLAYEKTNNASEGVSTIADKAGDIALSIDLLEELGKLDYIQLATALNTVRPELLAAAMDELATLENGWKVIESLNRASKDKLDSQ